MAFDLSTAALQHDIQMGERIPAVLTFRTNTQDAGKKTQNINASL